MKNLTRLSGTLTFSAIPPSRCATGLREGCRMTKRTAVTRMACAAALVALCALNALGWGSKGHQIINLKAAMHLPGSMAALRADSLFFAAHASDADIRKVYGDTSFFAESPRHYIDIDRYPSYLTLPHGRDSVVALYGWDTVKDHGTLPWAIQIVMDSLTAQFERMDTVAAKYTMSDLGHYLADAHQPFHCTGNYDGQYTNNNGIHSRYESGMINTYGPSIVILPDSVRFIGEPLGYIFSVIYRSNAVADSLLRADDSAKAASGWNGTGTAPAAYYAALWQRSGALTRVQFQMATVAIASLWYTAWMNAGHASSVREVLHTVPAGFRLDQSFPNPFNPVSSITFSLPRRAHVLLRVYNELGAAVETLLDDDRQPGTYRLRWDAGGRASGVYFYRIVAGEFVQTRTMVLLK